MKKQVIHASQYDVTIEHGSFTALSHFLKKKKYASCFILCDENTLQHCLPALVTKCPLLANAEIIELESGENSKNLDFTAMIWQTLLENHADRNALIVNLGGGVITDIGGFAASVYKRGIAFIHIPTSLLAMADASVGGKTAIDFNGLKNVIGTFYQPQAVFINTDFLTTLPSRHFTNGLAEIYKIALVCDQAFWKKLPVLGTDELVAKSVILKNKIVLKDPFDSGLRKILNFGHTIGHAIEALRLDRDILLLHGEAVVAGMLIETHLSWQKKLISKKEHDDIAGVLSSKFPLSSIHDLSLKELLQKMAHDKKSAAMRPKFSLLSGIGSCKTDLDVSEAQIQKAVSAYNSLAND